MLKTITLPFLISFSVFCDEILVIDKDVYQGMLDRDFCPYFIKEPPRELCKVYYRRIHDGGAGNVFMPNLTLEKPTVQWNSSESSLYTLTLSYLIPYYQNWSFIETQLWMITNIPGGDIEKGEEKLEYIPPKAQYADEYFLSVLLIFKQSGKIDVKFNSSLDNNATRHSIRIQEFSEQYNLGVPVAGSFYYVYLPYDYDFYMRNVHENTRKPGTVYWI